MEFYCDEVFGGWEGCVPHVVIQKLLVLVENLAHSALLQ